MENLVMRELIKKHIHGNIARIGGSVDQLIQYDKKMNVTDINLLDGGFGSIEGLTLTKGCLHFMDSAGRKFRQEAKRFIYGQKVPLDRNTIELDMHYAPTRSDLMGSFDSLLSSNVIEHSPNVIFLLLNFHLITKKNGWMYHAIPNYRFTYDKYREPTQFGHFLEDFESHMDFSDKSHNDDYTQSAIEKDGWQNGFHQKYPVAYPYMHFHVFDESNTKELFAYIFEDVHCELIKSHQFSDNIIICSNVLNRSFKQKYGNLIDSVMASTYLINKI